MKGSAFLTTSAVSRASDSPGGLESVTFCSWASRVVLVVKNLAANAGDVIDVGSVLGSGRSLGGGRGNLLLKNPMDRRAG